MKYGPPIDVKHNHHLIIEVSILIYMFVEVFLNSVLRINENMLFIYKQSCSLVRAVAECCIIKPDRKVLHIQTRARTQPR